MEIFRKLVHTLLFVLLSYALLAQTPQEIRWDEISHKLSTSIEGNEDYGEVNAIAINGDYAVIGASSESLDENEALGSHVPDREKFHLRYNVSGNRQ